MGKCPNCSAQSWFLKVVKCISCGKECCERCSHHVLTISAMGERRACSKDCILRFEQKVLEAPPFSIGTELELFDAKEYGWFQLACVMALPDTDKQRYWQLVKQGTVPQISAHSELRNKFRKHALQLLANNIRAAGRLSDAAEIYEKQLGMYDTARELREKEKQVLVKKVDISVNINQLLQQIKDGGIVVVYRCPRCGGTLKIDKNTSIEKLRICGYCGSEIETMDLAEFLKTALS